MNTLRIVTIPLILLALTFQSKCLAWDWPEWLQRDTPENTIKALDKLKSVGDVEVDTKHFTEKGKKLFMRMLKDANEDTSDRPDPEKRGTRQTDDAYKQFLKYKTRFGEVEAYVLIVKRDRWRFDDVICTRMLGTSLHLSMAEYAESPIKVTLKNPLMWKIAVSIFTGGLL